MAETKAACDLIFDYTYQGAAAQTTTMTVLGESESSSGVTPDETIQVNVTAAQLNDLLTVGTQSAPGVGYPGVDLDWTVVATPLNSSYTSFVAVNPTTSGDQFSDGASADVDTLQRVFSSKTFSFPTSPLDSIPIEAIKSVDYSGVITVLNYATDDVMSGKLVSATQASLLGSTLSAGTDSSLADPREAAVRSLYLQALAADRYKQSTASAQGDQATSQGASEGFNFQVGDTLTVYTDLTLVKTRKFVPDTTSVVGGTPGTMKFAIDGCNVVIGDGTLTDDKYDSDPLHHIVAWKLTVQ